MNSPEWHRVLRERWRHVDLPAAAVTYWCTSYEPDDALSLEALLRSDERLVTLVLSGPPAVGSRGLEELIAGLRSGIAGIIWCRTDDGRTANEESLRSYVVDGRAADLPSGARRLRLAAQRLPGRAQSAHLGRQLALLWDDPDRFADVPGENGT